MNPITHYIPAYAARCGRREAAICGVFCDRVIAPRIHSINPTCPTCRDLLVKEDAELARLSETWERDDASVARAKAAQRAERIAAGVDPETGGRPA